VGVHVADGATNVTVGGAAAGSRNVISGNSNVGVNVSDRTTTGVQIQGNYIDTDSTGAASLPNASNGVLLVGAHALINAAGAAAVPNGGSGADLPGAVGATVGGTAAGARNVISGNNGDGVSIRSTAGTVASGNIVQGNYIGLDISGAVALPNGNNGITI